MIRLDHVTKVFNPGRPNEYAALHGVSLDIEAGKVTVLRGPSGSGKTTLLSLIGCMARPSSGRIFVEEREITSLPERFLADIRRRTFGFVFQSFNLVGGLSVLENVVLPAAPLGEPPAVVRRRARAILDRLRLGPKAAQRVELLSGGEKQRAAIARALINSPRLIIADEPTAQLDSELSLELMAIVGDLKDEGRTCLIASHDSLVFRHPVVDRVVAVRDGRIVEAGADVC